MTALLLRVVATHTYSGHTQTQIELNDTSSFGAAKEAAFSSLTWLLLGVELIQWGAIYTTSELHKPAHVLHL
jgi:hypothetical protein